MLKELLVKLGITGPKLVPVTVDKILALPGVIQQVEKAAGANISRWIVSVLPTVEMTLDEFHAYQMEKDDDGNYRWKLKYVVYIDNGIREFDVGEYGLDDENRRIVITDDIIKRLEKK